MRAGARWPKAPEKVISTPGVRCARVGGSFVRASSIEFLRNPHARPQRRASFPATPLLRGHPQEVEVGDAVGAGGDEDETEAVQSRLQHDAVFTNRRPRLPAAGVRHGQWTSDVEAIYLDAYD